MSFLNKIFGFGGLARDVGSAIRENTEVFHVNETEEMHANAERFQSALSQYSSEFERGSESWFGQTVDGMNRLPRPIMALGTISLFGFALYDPIRFTERMQGLQEVPDPLWWLMGAIVSFYFGARELHYFRAGKALDVTARSKKPLKMVKPKDAPKPASKNVQKPAKTASAPAQIANNDQNIPHDSDNAAIADWIKSRS